MARRAHHRTTHPSWSYRSSAKDGLPERSSSTYDASSQDADAGGDVEIQRRGVQGLGDGRLATTPISDCTPEWHRLGFDQGGYVLIDGWHSSSNSRCAFPGLSYLIVTQEPHRCFILFHARIISTPTLTNQHEHDYEHTTATN